MNKESEGYSDNPKDWYLCCVPTSSSTSFFSSLIFSSFTPSYAADKVAHCSGLIRPGSLDSREKAASPRQVDSKTSPLSPSLTHLETR